MKIKKIHLILFVFFLIFLPLVSAKAFFNSEDNIYIPKEQKVASNFWRVGNDINISGIMEKDVIVMGGRVVIDGEIKGDLIGVADSLEINGKVGGNVRFAAESIVLNGEVGRNFNTISDKLDVNGKAGWEIKAYSDIFSLNAEQDAPVFIYGKEAAINKNVNDNLTLNIDNGGKIVFAKDVVINGDLKYPSIKNIANLDSVKVGGIMRAVPVSKSRHFTALPTYFRLMYFLSMAVVGLFALLFGKSFFAKSSVLMQKGLARILYNGLLYLILIPLFVLLCFISIAGIPLGIITIALYCIAVYSAKIIAGYAIGSWILQKTGKLSVSPYVILLCGLIIVNIFIALPYIGGLISLLITIAGLGAMGRVLKRGKAD